MHCSVVEPLAVLGMAYLSYLSAELFHFSGIIRWASIEHQMSCWISKVFNIYFVNSTIGCGLIQAHYSFANISHKSYTTVKYFIKMLRWIEFLNASRNGRLITCIWFVLPWNSVRPAMPLFSSSWEWYSSTTSTNGIQDSSSGRCFYASQRVS